MKPLRYMPVADHPAILKNFLKHARISAARNFGSVVASAIE